MNSRKLSTFLFTLMISFCAMAQDDTQELATKAESLFRGVYGGDVSIIDHLVSENFVSSYPIFEKILDKKAIRGRDAYKEFAIGFNSRWKDCTATIHETISEKDKVVLIWSFKAKIVNKNDSNSTVDEVHSWGGITLFRFDESGKITEEIGEESTPGPYGRLK